MVDFTILTNLINENSSKIIIAVSIILLGVVIARFISKLIYKVLIRINLSNIIKNNLDLALPLEDVISTLAKYIIYFLSLYLALSEIGIRVFIGKVILVIILILTAVIVFFVLKDFGQNFVAGALLHKKKLIRKGDVIEVLGINGKVLEVKLLDTKIINKEKELFILPNSVLIKAVAKNRKRNNIY